MRRNACWFLPKHPVIRVRRTAAIGDVIASTCVADKLAQAGFTVAFQAAPGLHTLLKRQDNVTFIEQPHELPDVNLDNSYENHPQRTSRHFSDLFLSSANKQLEKRGIYLGVNVNARPTLRVSEEEKTPYLTRLQKYPKPWIFICPRSGSWANRTIPPRVWQEAVKNIEGSKFWMFAETPPEGCVNLNIATVAELPVWLSIADLLVTVDTGPLHIAAAVGCPIVAIEQASSPELHLNDQRDFVVVRHPDLDCLNCQKNICPKSENLPPCQNYPHELISNAVNKRLRSIYSEDVSAVITIFRPPVERLRRCIDHVSQQVSEIIVTCDAGGAVPTGAPRSSKIRYVQHRERDLGFGRNANFGARHSNGKHILLLNDDVYLRPDAVAKLRECMTPDVGLVGNLLYYEDGTIQHGGKFRNPGMRGWGHIDHRKMLPTIKAPHQCENVTLASALVRRKAFYDAHGFNEEFFLYAEDDAFCLQIGQAGYKVFYTPLAIGTHLEGQTNKHLQNFNQRIHEGNEIFGRNWGWWLDQNLNRVPGVF